MEKRMGRRQRPRGGHRGLVGGDSRVVGLMTPRALPLGYVLTQFAAKCLEHDCQVIFDCRSQTCPACASEHFLPLDAWLDRVMT